MKEFKCLKCRSNTHVKKIKNNPETYICGECGFKHRIDRVSLLDSFERIRDEEYDSTQSVMVWNDLNGRFSIQPKKRRKRNTDHIIFDDVNQVRDSFGISENEDIASAVSSLDWQYILENVIGWGTIIAQK